MSITLVFFLIVGIFFIIVIESVRRGILETKYSILWIITCIFLGILSLSENLLEFLADFAGIAYAPSLLFLFGLLCTLIMIFDLTRRISSLSNKMIVLTQEYALLKEEHRKELAQMKKETQKKEEE
ncbi:hypothetical protein CIL03_12080 [Virgibacillus indicus]|uniref:DUF2304 domain-containing protein n=1 Tax=Virgibacillus indicus TaxID=2024554 RepID=A0A265N8L8_9BACI|nr:DUF2304 domain-containing protein [Virgibacillus indicus]OZU88380.1 hypothetical protein CIL03_12080 [Virgibacillus indicus]